MFLCLYVPLLSASTTTAKQIQSKLLKLENCHHNSRVNVLKLPFSTRVNIQTPHILEMHITQCPHGAKRFVSQNCIFQEGIGFNEILSSVINVRAETLFAQMHREDTLCCVRA